MRISLSGSLIVVEPTYPRERYPVSNAGESRLFYHVKNLLNGAGFDLIKTCPGKDGHWTDSPYYLRCRAMSSKAPHIYVMDEMYQIRIATEDFNAGKVRLCICDDVFYRQPNCMSRVMELLREPIVGEPMREEG